MRNKKGSKRDNSREVIKEEMWVLLDRRSNSRQHLEFTEMKGLMERKGKKMRTELHESPLSPLHPNFFPLQLPFVSLS